METLIKCPVCGNSQFSHYLSLSDYFFSGEDFNIVNCDNCSFRFTNPRPISSEIGKYYESKEYISHSNTHKGLFSLLYQNIRKYTIKSKFRLISCFAKGNSILDIGCATGEFLNFLKNEGWNVTGVEPNEKARKFARKEYGLNVEDENFLESANPSSIDVVTMWHVLEHVPDLNTRLDEIHRILKDDGVVFIAVPNSDSQDAGYYKKYWAGFDVPRHLYHFTNRTMKTLLQNHGFRCIKEVPMKFDALYVSLLSEKYIHGKNRWLAALLYGIRSNLKAKRRNNYSSMIFVAEKIKT